MVPVTPKVPWRTLPTLQETSCAGLRGMLPLCLATSFLACEPLPSHNALLLSHTTNDSTQPRSKLRLVSPSATKKRKSNPRKRKSRDNGIKNGGSRLHL